MRSLGKQDVFQIGLDRQPKCGGLSTQSGGDGIIKLNASHT